MTRTGGEGGGTGEGFVWPPRTAAGEPAGPPPPTALPDKASVIEAFEETWIGVRGRSFARAAALAGWAPDAREAYCWRCGTSVGAFEADGEGCAACRSERVPWDRFVRVGSYEGLMRESILQLKFERWRRTGTDLGRMLGRAIADELERRGVERGRAAIVPVPTSFWHRMGRGVDHTEVIARAAARESGVRVVRALRRKHGAAQTSVPASERAANVRGKILARAGAARGGVLGGVEIAVVVDDIRTTGATMRAACGAVRAAMGGGMATRPDPDRERVWAAAVAVTPSRERRGGGSSGV